MTLTRIRLASLGATLMVCFGWSQVANAASDATNATIEERFVESAAALNEGRATNAIDILERISDEGIVHPDAAFNRGLAYLARARSDASRPGDLGQAVAAFEEVALLTAIEADRSLANDLAAEARKDITRGRAKAGRETRDERQTFEAAVLDTVSTNALRILLGISSVVLAAGIRLRRATQESIRLGAWIALGISAAAFAASLFLAIRKDARIEEVTLAIVVVPEASLTSDSGAPLPLDPAPEGARIEVRATRLGRSEVRWGSERGYLKQAELRSIGKPR